MNRSISAIAASFALVASSASGAILAQYSITGGSLVATTVSSGTSSNLSLGSSYSVSGDTVVTDTLSLGPGTTSANNQISFTFTVSGLTVGQTITIDSVTAFISGFTVNSNRHSITDTGGQSNSGGAVNWSSGITLSRPGTLSGLVNGDTVNYNFAIRDNVDTNIGTYVIDDFTLNGTVIPEPSSALLLGIASLMFVTHRKRRA